MNGALLLRNRQRTRRLDGRRWRSLIKDLLEETFHEQDYDLAIHFIGEKEMTRLNASTLQHAGSTDVITFDYSDGPDRPLVGEIYVCLDEALVQAARFRTTWQAELVRYIIHGILHLRGYDDLAPAARRKMKHKENQILRQTAWRFRLSKLQPKPNIAA